MEFEATQPGSSESRRIGAVKKQVNTFNVKKLSKKTSRGGYPNRPIGDRKFQVAHIRLQLATVET